MALGSLNDSVQFLRGVGPRRAPVLAELGIRTVGELLHYFPRDLTHLPGRQPICHCRGQIGQMVTLGGVVERVRWTGRPWKPIFNGRLADNSGFVELVWFNAAWLRDKLGEGDRIIATGKLQKGRYGPQLTNPKFKRLRDDAPAGDDDAAPDADRGDHWEPVYPATAEISSGQLRAVIEKNLPELLALVDDPLPPEYLRRRRLIPRWLAVAWMHFPTLPPDARPAATARPAPLPLQADLDAATIRQRLEAARRRLAWDEALVFQLALARRRHDRQEKLAAVPLACSPRIRQRIEQRFPFALTAAQSRCVEQIFADMARAVPMNRLLQGDVGSGKTAVALFASLLAVAHGQQAAIMAPTEILAGQHYQRIGQYLDGSRVRYALLTGSLSAAQRRGLHQQIAAGEIDLVVGTTALLSEGVRFARLALAIVDEQHKFGVRQRSDLRDKGRPGDGPPPEVSLFSRSPIAAEPETPASPHTLVMTATPIPRSLAMTVFGDLAVSTIDELPPGRGAIQTRVAGPAEHDAAWDFLERQLAAGGQAYVVCPHVGPAQPDADELLDDDAAELPAEPSPGPPMANAEETFAELAKRFDRFGLGLVHGRMSRERQRETLDAFAAGALRVLVATTVVEVGVDVPAATVMVVRSAQRFGLAQLHQLRGRIGRGSDSGTSHCLLLADTAGQSAQRLRILEQTGDGFRIAEEDLARRGPGQFFGIAQHGLPDFAHLDLARDLALLRAARTDAFKIIGHDPSLSAPSHVPLRRQVIRQYGRQLAWADAG